MDPLSVAEVVKLKRIAMGEFEGRQVEASTFAHDLENLLTSVRIHGKPYFEIVPMRKTASVLQTMKRSFRDLTRPKVARSVGSSVKADGIFLGSIIRSGVTESPY